jgi:CRISPR-associated protein Cas2
VAERLRYLLAYDIRDPRRLRHVHRTATDYGEPLQFSLFVCDLTKAELLRLKASLIAEMNLAVDSVGIFDLGTPAGRGVTCIEFIGARRDLPETGPAIW